MAFCPHLEIYSMKKIIMKMMMVMMMILKANRP